MRVKFYSALLTLGLAATAVAKSGHAEVPTAITPRMELVIDASLHPAEFHFTRALRPSSIWDLDDVSTFGRSDFTELNLALSSPGLLFGVPHDFFTLSVHFGSGATTGVVFPGRSK